MTMDYLATCILDIGDGRRAEWYDFVWNRTRAIRKVSGLTSPTLTSYCFTCTCIFVHEQYRISHFSIYAMWTVSAWWKNVQGTVLLI